VLAVDDGVIAIGAEVGKVKLLNWRIKTYAVVTHLYGLLCADSVWVIFAIQHHGIHVGLICSCDVAFSE